MPAQEGRDFELLILLLVAEQILRAVLRLGALRAELGAPADFALEALAEAEAAARRPLPGRAVDIPFVTIDPPGARDLDQALHIERRGGGYRVRYAIADVAAFVDPG